MTGEMEAPEVTNLQELIWPELGICTERDLYVRVHGQAGASADGSAFHLFKDSTVEFNTWFNLFNIGTWQRHCELNSLYLQLQGQGQFAVTIFLSRRGHSWDRLDQIIEITPQSPAQLDLSALLPEAGRTGIFSFELRAIGEGGQLTAAAWQTADAPRRTPDLALAVTTFKREAEVARTVERFAAFRERSWMKDHVQMIVTDNGQSLDLQAPAGVTVIPNENLGGAGGFTRGLLEARRRGASHCLFMDDDASIHMESLERTWMLLAYAKDPTTAIAGAMISEQHRWAMWENGALFQSRCKPQHMGTDLRAVDQILDMEWQVSGAAPENLYGGWWYFAFPLDQAEHLAFPFFVRGDDVSFSLVNDFNIVRLNGVVSFQESFTEKESPQTWYLDLRSHMAHHLSLPSMEIGRWGVLKIAVIFMLRNLPRMHYGTLAAINLAVEDVMQGPEFFDENADMAQRRADLKALTGDETWQPLENQDGLPPLRHEPPNPVMRLLMKLTLNGLLLPFFGRLGQKITVLSPSRGHIGFVWGASEITFLNADRSKCYTVRHSKTAAWRQLSRFVTNARAFWTGYDALHARYQGKYDTLTSNSYWMQKLGLQPQADTTQDAAE